MKRLANWIDAMSGTEQTGVVRLLERSAFVFLLLTAAFSPHSIAATQTAWLVGMTLWIARIFFKPRSGFRPTAVDYLLWGYFAWSIISAIFSYAPDISVDRLRIVSLFFILYFAYHNIRNARAARTVAAVLIASSMIAVLWTPAERLIGRGVQVYDFAGGPFEQIALDQGDTILEVNGQKVSSLDEIKARIDESPSGNRFKAKVYHSDAYITIDIPTDRIKASDSAETALSVNRWTRGRVWRAAGFFGHYTTFAEVLQLLMSLAFGLFASLALKRFFVEPSGSDRWLKILGFCLAMMSLALILTATRASQAAFLISAVVIVASIGNRKMLITLAAITLPLAMIGLIVLQQTRGVGFLDRKDNSTTWRQTVYREGVELATKNFRHLMVGVGMDSTQRFAREWKLFDDGRLPPGHFHSTPLQIAVERGMPALFLWIGFFAILIRQLWRARNQRVPVDRGIVIGILGGSVGFFASGLVHYNLGDSEVAMLFFLLAGVGLKYADNFGAPVPVRVSAEKIDK